MSAPHRHTRRCWREHRARQAEKNRKRKADQRFGGDTSKNGEVTVQHGAPQSVGPRPSIADQYRAAR